MLLWENSHLRSARSRSSPTHRGWNWRPLRLHPRPGDIFPSVFYLVLVPRDKQEREGIVQCGDLRFHRKTVYRVGQCVHRDQSAAQPGLQPYLGANLQEPGDQRVPEERRGLWTLWVEWCPFPTDQGLCSLGGHTRVTGWWTDGLRPGGVEQVKGLSKFRFP